VTLPGVDALEYLSGGHHGASVQVSQAAPGVLGPQGLKTQHLANDEILDCSIPIHQAHGLPNGQLSERLPAR
jgi:hypothetical protein